MDLYFKKHDGQAVTCEDFFASMRDANDIDFSNFLLWYACVASELYFFRKFITFFTIYVLPLYRYSQAGTPSLKVTSTYDAEAKTYSLKFRLGYSPFCLAAAVSPLQLE